jgi:hypothetical protein
MKALKMRMARPCALLVGKKKQDRLCNSVRVGHLNVYANLYKRLTYPC